MADSYEIHVHKDGRWQIDNVTDNKEQALESARDLTTSKHIQGVKVIEEKAIGDDGETRSRTIFNQSKKGGKSAKKKGKKKPDTEDDKPAKKKKKRSATSIMIIALVGMSVLLVGVIVAALIFG